MRTAAEVLRDARSRIDTPEKWCKSRTFIGKACCSVGALKLATYYAAPGRMLRDGSPEYRAAFGEYGVARDALWDVVRADGHIAIEWMNDEPATTHATVLAYFDRAIAAAEQT